MDVHVTQTSASFFHSVRRGQIRSSRIPDEVRPASLADGYVAQSGLVEGILACNGGSLIGYKAACTNAHAQELLSTDFPVFGRLFLQFVLAIRTGSRGRFISHAGP